MGCRVSAASLVDGALSSSEVCEQAGVSFRQLDHWLRRGVFGDDAPTVKGSGDRRLWSPDVVPAVRVVGRVSAALSPRLPPGTKGRGFDFGVSRAVYAAARAGRTSVDLGGVIISWEAE